MGLGVYLRKHGTKSGGHPQSLTCLQTVFSLGNGVTFKCDICEDKFASWRARVQWMIYLNSVPCCSSAMYKRRIKRLIMPESLR
jgi:hypothetical protein